MYYFDDFLLFNYENKSLFIFLYSYIDFKKKTNKIFDDYIIDFIDIEFDIDKLKICLLKDKHDKTFRIIINILITNIISHKTLENLLKYLSFYIYIISFE